MPAINGQKRLGVDSLCETLPPDYDERTTLPTEVGEGFVRIRHAMHILST